LYLAVEQDAFIIEINDNNTNSTIFDNKYKLTGGGQLINVVENSAAIFQQAMIDLVISNSSNENPISGSALIKKTKTHDSSFPELDIAILEFHEL
jgi:hypothetical protein